MNAEQIEQLAHSIARDLFTDGTGQHAGRLVMEYDDGNRARLGGGWCEAAVVNRVRLQITDAVLNDLRGHLHGEQGKGGEG